jgi:pimeloyl-ACP methyl ester carboxylesterase
VNLQEQIRAGSLKGLWLPGSEYVVLMPVGMETQFIPYKSSQIHFARAGSGNNLLLCFHGYGESAESFAFLETLICDDFTMIAIDLPFHGQTVWNEGLLFKPADLLIIIEKIIQHTRFVNQKKYLLGYSMGGRVVLHLVQYFAEEIDKIILLAPDGFEMNFSYWLATQTWLGNKLFHITMARPGWIFLLLRACNKLGLINQSIFKFTSQYLSSRQARIDLYKRWTTMRVFRPDISRIKELVSGCRIGTRLLYGAYDRMIKPQRAKRFRKGIESHCTLSVIDSGHQLLQGKNAVTIVSLIKS